MNTHPPIRELVNRWRNCASSMTPGKAEVLFAAADDLSELLNVLDRRVNDFQTNVIKGLPGEFSSRVQDIQWRIPREETKDNSQARRR